MTATTLDPRSPPATTPTDSAAGTGTGPGKIAVWDLPTRIFHWSLALSFAGAFITAESERWRDVHVMLGYAVLGLIAFRLVWGLVGSRYARFSSFATGPGRIVAYLKSLLASQPQHHVGHNPAGAIAIFLLLGLGLAVGASGYAVYNEIGGDWLEETHEVLANGMLGIVAVHVIGVVISSLMHRENLVLSMITGNKAGRPDEGIPSRHRILGVILLVALCAWGGWYWTDNASRVAGRSGESVSATGAGAGAGEGRRQRADD